MIVEIDRRVRRYGVDTAGCDDGIFQGLLHVNRPGDHLESVKEFLGHYAWRLHDMR